MALLSPTLSRIYTPPTCTLEVTAQASALSRWTRTPAIKSLQFFLSLDGLPGNGAPAHRREPLELRGNQAQLIRLSETVADYIQKLLVLRPGDVPLTQPSSPVENSPQSVAQLPTLGIHPRTLLTHELVLGDLATEQSGPSVLLKVSQLYDLATALEDCTADLQHIPEPLSPVKMMLPIAQRAAVVLLTVGLGTAAWRLLQVGPMAVNQAERSPATTTALAPSPSASVPVESLPSPVKGKASPLVLPPVKLPSRSPDAVLPSVSTSASADQTSRDTATLEGNTPAATAPSKTMASLPPEPSSATTRQTIGQQEIALAPAREAASLSQSAGAEGQQADLSDASKMSTNSAASSMAPPMAPPMAAPSAISSARRSVDQATSSGGAPRVGGNAMAKRTPQGTLFDTNTQVVQVRDYVESRWQPNPPPSSTLEYRVTLNRDGSLAKVDPLGGAAQRYLNKLPLPAVRDPFVSPLESGTSANIRLVLRPDGTVQTFSDP